MNHIVDSFLLTNKLGFLQLHSADDSITWPTDHVAESIPEIGIVVLEQYG